MASKKQWYVRKNGKEHGPVSSAELKRLARSGKISPGDQVRPEDRETWSTANAVKGLFLGMQANEASPGDQSVSTPPQLPAVVPAADAAPKTTSSGNGMIKKVGLCIGLMIPFIGGVRGCIQAGSGSRPDSGTITFAEHVNQDTMEALNEGQEFTTGWVWMLVRGVEPFGEAKIAFYGRVAGDQEWQVLGEELVDPEWDTVATQEFFGESGSYDIKVITLSGKLVAQSTVSLYE